MVDAFLDSFVTLFNFYFVFYLIDLFYFNFIYFILFLVNESSSDEGDDSENDNSDFATDNAPSEPRQSLPKTADMFTFWATVPGYASVRHKKKGTWFIQALCKLMVDYGNR